MKCNNIHISTKETCELMSIGAEKEANIIQQLLIINLITIFRQRGIPQSGNENIANVIREDRKLEASSLITGEPTVSLSCDLCSIWRRGKSMKCPSQKERLENVTIEDWIIYETPNNQEYVLSC